MAPAGPPEPQLFESQATTFPSASAAVATSAWVEGRAPATLTSWSRSSISFTGRPVSLAIWAQTTPQRSTLNLLPKPPPMYWVSTWTFEAGMPICSPSCEATPEIAWVEAQSVTVSSSCHSATWPWDSREQWAICATW